MHSHYTSGMASMAYLKAVEAGADILDCAISSMSMGTSHPPTESMVAALAGTDRATGMDIGLLEEISEYFRDVRKKYAAYESAFTAVDPAVLLWQIPGGMISNLSSQLKEQGALDRMDEVLAEVPRVREELGYPPLVTPTSQIVGTQATLNVLMGRYKMITKETKAYVQGFYGRSPGPDRPRGAEALHRRRDAHHHAARPTRSSRSCPSAGPSWRSWASSTAKKTCCPTPCSRRWRWSSSRGATARSARRRSWPRWWPPWPICWACRTRPVRAAAGGAPRPAAPTGGWQRRRRAAAAAPGSAWAAAGRQISSPAARSRGGTEREVQDPRRRQRAPGRGGRRRDGQSSTARPSQPRSSRPSDDRRMVQVGDKSYEVRVVENCAETGILVLESRASAFP